MGWLTIIILLFAPMLAAAAPARATDLSGQASIIDGDTIEIHGTRIRLWGIDAPEHSQLCRGDDSERTRCGARAALALADFVAGKVVRCEPTGLDRYRRTVARCYTGDVDIAEWMVDSGLALDWPRYSHRRYAAAQHTAEHARRGIWSGSFVAPWLYRACLRAHGRAMRCSELPDIAPAGGVAPKP